MIDLQRIIHSRQALTLASVPNGFTPLLLADLTRAAKTRALYIAPDESAMRAIADAVPFFAPEIFKLVESADPLRSKQLRTGLMQLGEEGAIQVFRPMAGGIMLLGAFGQLQFEVVAHRLKRE